MKSCKIVVMDGNGDPVLAGKFVLDGSKISAQPEKGFEKLLTGMRSQEAYDFSTDKDVTVKDDPVKWFSLLPKTFVGSRVRAVME